jgi:hypothetical protein
MIKILFFKIRVFARASKISYKKFLRFLHTLLIRSSGPEFPRPVKRRQPSSIAIDFLSLENKGEEEDASAFVITLEELMAMLAKGLISQITLSVFCEALVYEANTLSLSSNPRFWMTDGKGSLKMGFRRWSY